MRDVRLGLAAAISMLGAVAVPGAGLAQSAAEACAEIAGQPEAGAPVSREALNTYFNTLGSARPHCEAAVIGAEPDAGAMFHLAVIMQREGVHERALEVFSMAGEAGVAAAHTKLGDYYNFGIGPVREDHKRAVAEYQKAVDGGDIPAMSTLAIMYQLGRGVRQDFDRMLELLTNSADAGYHFSQFRLAEIYMNPRSVPGRLARELDLPDPIKAAELYQKAAAQGSAEAEAALKAIYEGDGVFDDPEVRLKWVQNAADKGDAKAMNELGFMYEQGNGVEYDPVRAAELYIAALETGDLRVDELRGTVNGYTPRWDRETALNFQTILQERGLYTGALDAMVGRGTLGAAARLAQQ